jgi:hypothetical protein
MRTSSDRNYLLILLFQTLAISLCLNRPQNQESIYKNLKNAGTYEVYYNSSVSWDPIQIR